MNEQRADENKNDEEEEEKTENLMSIIIESRENTPPDPEEDLPMFPHQHMAATEPYSEDEEDSKYFNSEREAIAYYQPFPDSSTGTLQITPRRSRPRRIPYLVDSSKKKNKRNPRRHAQTEWFPSSQPSFSDPKASRAISLPVRNDTQKKSRRTRRRISIIFPEKKKEEPQQSELNAKIDKLEGIVTGVSKKRRRSPQRVIYEDKNRNFFPFFEDRYVSRPDYRIPLPREGRANIERKNIIIPRFKKEEKEEVKDEDVKLSNETEEEFKKRKSRYFGMSKNDLRYMCDTKKIYWNREMSKSQLINRCMLLNSPALCKDRDNYFDKRTRRCVQKRRRGGKRIKHLNIYTVKQLQGLCRKKKLKGYSNKSKKQLIKLCKKHKVI